MACGTLSTRTTYSRHYTSQLTGLHTPSRTSLPYIDIPMVHTRDREPVAQVVRRWLSSRKVLGSNPTSVHSLVWLP